MEIPAAAAPSFTLVRPPDPTNRLNIYLTILDGRIIMDFGRTIQWVGFTPEEAETLATDLSDAVRLARTIHSAP